ncbi:MAG: ribonuclease P protein component [Pseudomonadota bacterium]|nr:ribonuclease P protein component [Pseudomonadota bacterium]
MKQFPFRRHQRLLSAAKFQAVFKQTEGRVSHTAFLMLARNTSPQQPGRLGLVVAKKHLKRAVDRNRFKRVVRDRFRLSQHALQGLDVVILARPGSGQLDSHQLAGELDKYWGKLVRRCHQASKPVTGNNRDTGRHP